MAGIPKLNMNEEEQIKNYRLEYEKTQDMAVHHDTLNWTIGSILIAGIFLMVGTAGSNINVYPNLALFSFIALLVWRLYYQRHKGIQMIKFYRLHDIEDLLNLKQHTNVKEADEKNNISQIMRGDLYATLLLIMIPTAILTTYYNWNNDLYKTYLMIGISVSIAAIYIIYYGIKLKHKKIKNDITCSP